MFVVVDTEDLIQRVVVLVDLIWREHYPAVISEQQVEYMLAKFQGPESIQEQIREGFEYYLVCRGGGAGC